MSSIINGNLVWFGAQQTSDKHRHNELGDFFLNSEQFLVFFCQCSVFVRRCFNKKYSQYKILLTTLWAWQLNIYIIKTEYLHKFKRKIFLFYNLKSIINCVQTINIFMLLLYCLPENNDFQEIINWFDSFEWKILYEIFLDSGEHNRQI